MKPEMPLRTFPQKRILELSSQINLHGALILNVLLLKANRMLGFLRRNCADLGYASEVWTPQTIVHHLRIQCRATHFV